MNGGGWGHIVRIHARLSMSTSSFTRFAIQLNLLLMPIGVCYANTGPIGLGTAGRRSRTERFCLQKHMHPSCRLDCEHLLTCKGDVNEVH